MADAELPGGCHGVRRFVEGISGGSDCKSSEIAAELGYSPADQAGVDAAAEQGAHRNIGLKAQLDSFEKQAFGFIERLGKAWAAGRDRFGRLPVLAEAKVPGGPFGDGGRRKFLYAGVDGAIVGDIAELQIFGERLRIEGSRQARIPQRAHGRRKSQPAGVFDITQRLYAEAVARQKQRLQAIVPEGEGEHAAETGDQAVDAPFAVAMQQDLGIGAAAKLIAAAKQLLSQRMEVINGAVKNGGDAAVQRGHGLPAQVAQIEDGQAPMTEDRSVPDLEAFGVGAAAFERAHHFPNAALGGIPGNGARNSRNPAHKSSITLCGGAALAWRSQTGRSELEFAISQRDPVRFDLQVRGAGVRVEHGHEAAR